MKECKMFIGGRWMNAESGKTFTTVNPATQEELARIPLGGKADVDKAVKAARAAFPVWSKLKQAERSKMLNKVAALLRENARELALCDVLEHGRRITTPSAS